MVIDLLASLLAVFSLVSGYRSGMISQLLKLLVLAGAFFLARAVHPNITPHVETHLGLEAGFATTASMIIAWCSCYFILSLIRDSFVKRWRRHRPESGGADRLIGALFGFTKTAFAIYLMIAITLITREVIARAIPNITTLLGDSRVAQMVTEYNILEEGRVKNVAPARMRAMSKLLRLAGDPNLAERIRSDPEAREQVKQLMDLLQKQKPELFNSLKDGDISSLTKNPETLDFVNDPEVLKLIEAFPE